MAYDINQILTDYKNIFSLSGMQMHKAKQDFFRKYNAQGLSLANETEVMRDLSGTQRVFRMVDPMRGSAISIDIGDGNAIVLPKNGTVTNGIDNRADNLFDNALGQNGKFGTPTIVKNRDYNNPIIKGHATNNINDITLSASDMQIINGTPSPLQNNTTSAQQQQPSTEPSPEPKPQPEPEPASQTNQSSSPKTSSQSQTPKTSTQGAPLHEPSTTEHGAAAKSGNPYDIDVKGVVKAVQQQQEEADMLNWGAEKYTPEKNPYEEQAEKSGPIVSQKPVSKEAQAGNWGTLPVQDAPNEWEVAAEKQARQEKVDAYKRRTSDYDARYDEKFGETMRNLKKEFESGFAESQGLRNDQLHEWVKKNASAGFAKDWTDEEKKLFGTYLERQEIAEKNAQALFDSAKQRFDRYENNTKKMLGPDGTGPINLESLRKNGFLSNDDVKGIYKTVDERRAKASSGIWGKIRGRNFDVGAEVEKEARRIWDVRRDATVRDMENAKDYLARTQNYEAGAIADGQGGVSSTYNNIRKAQEKAATAEKKAASNAAKKMGGHGWKAKAGAVGGLLAIGAVLGSMMGGHGEQSNAQLYNPNPQPQYAN